MKATIATHHLRVSTVETLQMSGEMSFRTKMSDKNGKTAKP